MFLKLVLSLSALSRRGLCVSSDAAPARTPSRDVIQERCREALAVVTVLGLVSALASVLHDAVNYPLAPRQPKLKFKLESERVK